MTVIGTVELLAKINTADYKSGAKSIETTNKQLEKSGSQTTSNMNQGFSRVAKVGMAAIATAAVTVSALIIKNFGNAIKRVDTLNNSARTFANMGFTAKDVAVSMKALEKSIAGMPTSLDEAIRGVQMIAASTNDVKGAQKIFTALNNGILGFGGTAAQVSNAVQQLSQDLGSGRIQAETWNSLLDSGLAPALSAIAREMGMTSRELKEGLGEGTVSVDTFTKALIKMDTEGGGGMASLQKIAMDSTSGIATGWANLNTAITRGIASIIEAVGSSKISAAISSFGAGMESILKSVSLLIPKIVEIGTNIGTYLQPKFAALWTQIETQLFPALNKLWNNVIKPLIPAIGTALVVALGFLIDAITVLTPYIAKMTEFLAKNKTAVTAVIIAVVAFKAVLAFGKAAAAFNASLAGMRAALALYRTQGLASAIAQTKIFKALVTTPMIMPAIVIAAALAAIYVIQKELKKTLALMDRADDSANNLQDQRDKVLKRLQNTDDPKKQKQLRRILDSSAPGRAAGGFVAGGSMYTVGERGRELFVPETNGHILPNDTTESLLKGNKTAEVTQTSVNIEKVELSGIYAENRSQVRELGKMFIAAVNDELRAKQLPQMAEGLNGVAQ